MLADTAPGKGDRKPPKPERRREDRVPHEALEQALERALAREGEWIAIEGAPVLVAFAYDVLDELREGGFPDAELDDVMRMPSWHRGVRAEWLQPLDDGAGAPLPHVWRARARGFRPLRNSGR